MYRWSALNERQLTVLGLVAADPSAVSQRRAELARTVYALRDRGLVQTDRSSAAWAVQITPAGRFYLAHGHHPDHPHRTPTPTRQSSPPRESTPPHETTPPRESTPPRQPESAPGQATTPRPTGRRHGQGQEPRAKTGPIRIARIETVTMTPTEYDQAVEALAVLISRWWTEHPEAAP